MSKHPVTKHKFRYGEETYTICITVDDWWLDEPVDMSERMMKAGTEFALENGMAPPADLCSWCNDGTYVDTNQDYRVGRRVIKNLEIRKCNKCDHIVLPSKSVVKVDDVLEEKLHKEKK